MKGRAAAKEVLLLKAEIIALTGCEAPKCLAGKPPVLCRRCNLQVIAALAKAAMV